ncbi:hypothetical protein F4813DRAFT_127732 [Daldinia decipiens]|uniref:uncharacterized protein n=1 Tax=Daldinia decipiens TaxID=326647 RepID=UPI0020C1CF2D|nr:uncharacterized protein F4813DRAFT_127732 [Daldinia decipiens]KAI1656521.1 hypothetical protein F4813DRAFT_127732 [Daldinia decipiens]
MRHHSCIGIGTARHSTARYCISVIHSFVILIRRAREKGRERKERSGISAYATSIIILCLIFLVRGPASLEWTHGLLGIGRWTLHLRRYAR